MADRRELSPGVYVFYGDPLDRVGVYPPLKEGEDQALRDEGVIKKDAQVRQTRADGLSLIEIDDLDVPEWHDGRHEYVQQVAGDVITVLERFRRNVPLHNPDN